MRTKKILIVLLLVAVLVSTVYVDAAYNSPAEEVISNASLLNLGSGNAWGYGAIKKADSDETLDYARVCVIDISKKDLAPTQRIKQLLENSYQQILATDDIESLISDNGLSIVQYLKSRYPANTEVQNLKKEDLIITDLFHVSLQSWNEEVLKDGRFVLEFHLNTDIEDGEAFALIHNYEGREWIVEQNVEYKDGVLIAKVNSLSCFSIVRIKKDLVSADIPVGPVQYNAK